MAPSWGQVRGLSRKSLFFLRTLWLLGANAVKLSPMLQQDKQILWRISAVLLGIAMPTIMLGKAVMMVLLGLGALTGLLATKDESLRATVSLMLGSWMTLLVLAFLGVALVGVVTGINPTFSFDKWQQLVLMALGGILLFMTLREMPGRHLETLMRLLAFSTIIAAVLGLTDALVGDPRLSGAIHGPDKALTPYRLNYMSSVLAVLLPFVFARLTTKSREGEPFALRVMPMVVTVGVVAVIVCGGRAGWVGFGVSMAAFLWLTSRYHGLVIHARHWLMGLGLAFLSLLLYAAAFGWQFMVERATIVGEDGVGRGMLSGRGAVWHDALVHLLDKPFFGIGMMNYRNIAPGFDLHPHNWLLQLMLETGFVGTAVFLTIMGMLLVLFFRFAKGSLYGVAAFASVVAFLVSGLANSSIFNPWWVQFLLFSCILGWRAGWGGEDLKKRRRSHIVLKSSQSQV